MSISHAFTIFTAAMCLLFTMLVGWITHERDRLVQRGVDMGYRTCEEAALSPDGRVPAENGADRCRKVDTKTG